MVLTAVSIEAVSKKAEPVLVIDRSVTQDAMSAWIGYGGSLISSIEDGHKRDCFDTELKAREFMVDFWLKVKEEKHTDTYIEELVKVRDASYLREYVWTFFRTPAWGAPPDGLKLVEFWNWRADHLRGHRPQTLAAIKLPKPEKPVSAWSRDRKTDTWTHHYSGYCFPKKAGPFERAELHSFDTAERDVAIAYNSRRVIALTAYVYPLDSSVSESADTLDAEFRLRQVEIKMMHPGALLISEGQGTLTIQGKTLAGVEAVFEMTDDARGSRERLHSRLSLCIDGDNFFKVRMTYPQAIEESAAEARELFLRDFHAPGTPLP